MNKDKLIEAVGQIDDDLVAGYNLIQQKRKIRQAWRKPALLAACLCLVAFSLYGAFSLGLIGFGASSDGTGRTADRSGYMFYPGPVFPLAVLEDAAGLAVSRGITFDFSPYETQLRTYETTSSQGTVQKTDAYYQRSSLVTDHYALTNDSRTEKTVTLVYPFAGALDELAEIRPVLFLNGSETATDLVFGPYSGGFSGAWPLAGNRQGDETLNLADIDNWQGFAHVLADGSYREQAFAEPMQLDQPVTVYVIKDYAVVAGAGTNPTLGVHYTAGDQTTILSYGFHGMQHDDDGHYIQSFSLPVRGETPHAGIYCLIVLGEDIQDLRLQGYQDGGLKPGTEMGITAQVTRTDAVLADILRLLLRDFLSLYQKDSLTADTASFDRLYRAAVELLLSYGLPGQKPADRYDTGWLMDVFAEAGQLKRVMYLLKEITIPAGETIEVTAVMTRKGSHDFHCRNKRDVNIEGYDLVTSLGSNLAFTAQQASIIDHGLVEIVRQNFGFDLAQGIRTVPLDLAQAHYFLEIRKIADDA